MPSYCLIYAAVKAVNCSFVFWLPYYFQHSLGIDVQTSSNLASVFDLGAVVSAVLLGRLVDKARFSAFVTAPVLLAAVPCILAVRLASADDIWFLYLIVLVLGALTGGPSCVISSAVSADLATTSTMKNGKEAKSTVVGLVNGSGGIGAACAQMLMGMLATASWNWAFFFLVCELYSASAAIAGLTLLNFALEDWRTKPLDDQYGAPLLA